MQKHSDSFTYQDITSFAILHIFIDIYTFNLSDKMISSGFFLFSFHQFLFLYSSDFMD